MQVSLKLYDEKKDDPHADFLWDEVEKVAGEWKIKVVELSGILQEINQEADRHMVIIKNEMRKYA